MSTVLVIGSGGREHALAWKLAQSPHVTRLIVAPGNDGMPMDWERWPLKMESGFTEIIQKAQQKAVDLVVVGPDHPLALGIVDAFEAVGILAFGPKAGAAQIEASKQFSKEVMSAVHVPTARYFVAHSIAEAEKIFKEESCETGWVVKADGLAYGKGVWVCDTLAEAHEAVRQLISISGKLIIEEKLIGEELSWMAFCDGTRCALLEPARDYKRLLNGDHGPNTGGMGAVSPVPHLFARSEQYESMSEWVSQTVFRPVLEEMKRRGTEFRGLLYAGLMWNAQKKKMWVLEFNARFGDPEAQVLLPRINIDLYLWCRAAAQGDLTQVVQVDVTQIKNSISCYQVPFKKETAVIVVAATAGYPNQPVLGEPMHPTPLQASKSSVPDYFYAGIRKEADVFYTSGGRVFGALGMGPTLENASSNAYQNLSQLSFAGMQYRSDIGYSK